MSTERVPLHLVDAFAERPFEGNPAAVCLLGREAGAPWMQRVAAEMNLSETAFVRPLGAPGEFGLRWFTPVTEVELCGHATLASAHVLWERGEAPAEPGITFHTAGGALRARRRDGLVELDFPLRQVEACAVPDGLVDALGVRPLFTGGGSEDLLVEVEAEEVVRGLRPDVDELRSLPWRGIVVTAGSGDDRYDFVSRFFAPRVGIDEDPVTGSAHCLLAPYWARKLGREELTAFQASPRGGVVGVTVAGARVLLRGAAVTVLRGELCAEEAPS